MRRSLRLDRMIGRVVRTSNHRPLGRLEECRVVRRGHEWVVSDQRVYSSVSGWERA
jgi:hypothetical protein